MNITFGHLYTELLGKESLDRVLLSSDLRNTPIERVITCHTACCPINEFNIRIVVVEIEGGRLYNIVYETSASAEEVEGIAQQLNERLAIYRMVSM